MGWFRRPLGLIYNTFRSYNFNKSPIFRKTLQNVNEQHNQFKRPNYLDGEKKIYYVDRHKIHQLNRRRWFLSRGKLIIVGSGILLSLYDVQIGSRFVHLSKTSEKDEWDFFSFIHPYSIRAQEIGHNIVEAVDRHFKNIELFQNKRNNCPCKNFQSTVPYTRRPQHVLISRTLENEYAEKSHSQIMQKYEDKGKILPSTHPYSIRVQKIGRNITGALASDIWRASTREGDLFLWIFFVNKFITGVVEKGIHVQLWEEWRNHVKGVRYRQRKSQEQEMKMDIVENLEGYKWEVVVVDDPTENAFCMLGGKIVLFTGLLKNLETDAEIASVIGHEVGHAVARHLAEDMLNGLWVNTLKLVFYRFFKHLPVYIMSKLLIENPISRRMELEADYIGLILLASAGYDPRVLPKRFEELGGFSIHDYISTHPWSKTRAKALSNPKVMGEAMAIYQTDNTYVFKWPNQYICL